jgi:hypothetical protein
MRKVSSADHRTARFAVSLLERRTAAFCASRFWGGVHLAKAPNSEAPCIIARDLAALRSAPCRYRGIPGNMGKIPCYPQQGIASIRS